MSFRSKDSATTPWWAKKRVLGSALALSALVASGVAANASSHGDGFLGRTGSTSSLGGSTLSTTRITDTSWNWTGSAFTWNGDTWAWNGTGHNRFVFRAIAIRQDRTFNEALGVNDRGVIVGFFGRGREFKKPNVGFLVSPPYMQDQFRTIKVPGSLETQVVGVNNNGVSVGFFVDRLGANHGFVRSAAGKFRTVDFPQHLATLGTTSTWGGMSSLGTTSGLSSTGTVSSTGAASAMSSMSTLHMPTLTTVTTTRVNQLLGINNHNIAAGFFLDNAGRPHGYLFNANNGQFLLLRTPHGVNGLVATGINDRNQVVGFVVVGKQSRGFVWNGRAFIWFSLGAKTNTQALGINNAGSVVGSFTDLLGRTHGFLIQANGLIRQVDVPGSTSTVVNGINNKGLIVGFFTDKAKRTDRKSVV